jgi:hypothetical protein
MRNYLVTSFIALSFLISISADGQFVKIDPNEFFSSGQINAANTAINEEYLTKEEMNIYLYTNLARMYPKAFYEFYKAYVTEDGEASKLRSNYYFTSLTKELKTMDRVGPLLPDRKMFDLAECWAVESGEKGLIGHDRVDCPNGYSGENCGYGYDSTGLYFVMLLLIDEGVKGVGHRKNILFPDFKGLGAAIRDHKGYRYDAVQNFAYTNDVLRKEDSIREAKRKIKAAEEERKHKERLAEFGIAMNQWSKEEMAEADINRASDYLNVFEKDLFYYLNLARLYPKKFKRLLWDQGPFFDQPLERQQQYLHPLEKYKRIGRWLNKGQTMPAIRISQEEAEMGHCVATRYLTKRGNPTGCIKGFRSWRLQTFYTENNYNDAMNILMVNEDYKDLFEKQSTMLVQESDEFYVKVFMSR